MKKTIMPPAIGEGPLTLDMADTWLRWLEDIATLERDAGHAWRIVQMAIFAELVNNQKINGHAVIARLSQALEQIEGESYHLALASAIDDLSRQLAQLKPGGSDNARTH